MTLTCVDCGVTETLTERDKQRFEHLVKTVQGFQVPKRCNACRKRRRDEKEMQAPARPAPIPAPVISMKATPPVSVLEPVAAAPKPNILLVLATKDFDDLVHGRAVIWNGVKVVLADIGFDSMRKAIDDAEIEKAKKLVKANGY